MRYGSDALELNINYLSAVLAFRQKQQWGIVGNLWEKLDGKKILAEKTFANSHKTMKFMKVFSHESFPLQASPSLRVAIKELLERTIAGGRETS